MEFLKACLICFGVLLIAALIFSGVVLVVGAINQMNFYDVLCMWFGHGSWFASIFKK